MLGHMAKPQGEFYAQLGRALRDARKAKGITQEQLARAVGLSRPSVVNIERGKQPLQVHAFVDIARAIGARPSDLIPENALLLPSALEGSKEIQRLSKEKRQWVASIVRDVNVPQQRKKI